ALLCSVSPLSALTMSKGYAEAVNANVTGGRFNEKQESATGYPHAGVNLLVTGLYASRVWVTRTNPCAIKTNPGLENIASIETNCPKYPLGRLDYASLHLAGGTRAPSGCAFGGIALASRHAPHVT